MSWSKIDLDATELRSGRWAVRPKGQLGTCGFHPFPWTVRYVNANNEQQAIEIARKESK